MKALYTPAMQIRNMPWEKENLGRETTELTAGPDDLDADILEQAVRMNAEYSLVRIPAARNHLLHALEDAGFRHLELRVHLSAGLASFAPPDFLQPLLRGTSTLPVTSPGELNLLLDTLEEASFATDRVSLDPALGPALALRRYRNWIRSEFERGTRIRRLLYEGREAGFFLLRDEGHGLFDSLLLGVGPAFQNTGLGLVAIALAMREARELCGRKIKARVSSNNPASFNAHIRLGYRIDSIESTLRRISE